MRVLVISQLPPPVHGSTLITRKLIDTLYREGLELDLVDRRFSRSVSQVGKFSLRKTFSAFALQFRLISRLRAFRPDQVIFFATTRKLSFLADWLMSETLRFRRARVILYLHTVGFSALASRGSLLRWMTRRVLQSAECVVCLGPSVYEDIRAWVHASRVVFIPNTSPDDPPPPDEVQSSGYVLFLSNVLADKGPDTFVEIARQLAESQPGRRFVVAGSSSDHELELRLQRRVDEAGLADRVERVTHVDPDERWDLLEGASILVFPSRYPFEAQPIVILEAMAMGRPVVAYDIGGVRDIVRDDWGCTLVPPEDIGGAVAAVQEALGDPLNLKSRGASARAAYLAEFSSEAYATRWRRLVRIDSCASDPCSGQHERVEEQIGDN